MSRISYPAHAGNLLQEYLHSFLVEITPVCRGNNMEALHRMRVSSRRLRAALVVFDGAIPHKKVKAYRKAIRAAGRLLGQGRQLDIQLRFLAQMARAEKDAGCRAGIKVIAGRLAKERALAQQQIIAVVRSPLTGKTLAALQDIFARKKHAQGLLYGREAFAGQKEIARRRLDELLRYVPCVYKPEMARELHLMRIAAKNLRYTLEIMAPLYARRIHRYIRQARAVQDVLGDLHEFDVWLAYLPEVSCRQGSDPRVDKATVFLRKKCLALRGRTYAKFIKLWKEQEVHTVWNQLASLLLENKH